MMIEDLAREFSAMLRLGQMQEAAEKYCSVDIVSLKPGDSAAGISVEVSGYTAVHEQLLNWLSLNRMEDICIDGPFVTGDQFALFIDMQIVRIATGERKPFSEIATFKVSADKIIEERFYYP